MQQPTSAGDVLALDFDGTLVESFTDRPLPGVAERLASFPGRIVIITNQAGPAWRAVTGGDRYPTAERVASLLDQGLRAVSLPPARVALLFAATFPAGIGTDGATALAAASSTAEELLEGLRARGWSEQAYTSHSPGWRKPEPGMLAAAALTLLVPRQRILYVGDRESDREAAARAGTRFQWAADWRAG